MKTSSRFFSIVVALGLLVGAFGVGSALARQADRSTVDVLGAAYAPAALVVVAENEVEWADQAGNAVSWVKPDSTGVLIIRDDALETTAGGTGVWSATTTASAIGDLFSIPDGKINGIATAGVYTLTAAQYDAATPANTPLTALPTVTVGGVSYFVGSGSFDGGTFGLLQTTATSSAITATFSHHIRDRFDASTTALKRARVTSTSDPQGEYAWIQEVAGVDSITTVAAEVVSNATTTSVTVAGVPIVDSGADGLVSAADVTVSVGGVALGTANSTWANYAVDTVNFNTGAIAYKNTATGATGVALPNPAAANVTVAYKHATASATARLFRGQISLTSNAAAQGTNNDGVWVQDGDTLTVQYLSAAGAVLDSDAVTVDGVKPTISAISPADGTITNVVNPTVTFEVTDTGAGITAVNPGTAVTLTINGVVAANPSFQAIANGFRIIYASGVSWLLASTGPPNTGGFNVADGRPFTWKIEAVDVAGNTKTLSGTDLDLTIDVTKPTVQSAVTGTRWDVDTAAEKTGSTTSVKVVFSEKLTASSVDSSGSDFTVGGVQPSAAIVGSTAGTKMNVYLTVSALAPDAKPEVKVVSSILDEAGSAVDTALATAKTNATDGLKPSATVTVSRLLAVKDDVVKVTVDTDEKLATDGLKVSYQGPAGSPANGLKAVTGVTPLQSTASLTVAAGTITGKYGVSIQATDLGNNAKDNLTAVTDEVAIFAADPNGTSTVITLAKGPVADANFDGAMTGADITALTVATVSQTANIVSVNASARTITINTGTGPVPAGTAVKVSYKYVKDNVFEVDQAAPTVTFDPADATSIENASPFIRIIFDEDEYPGDSYKTVTLTAASLKKPDGTTSDVKANFVTTDSQTFIWAASNLALGSYTLTASGKDIAGNEVKDAATSFTIKERAKYEVALRPGWNLVSLPGDPADGAIASVIDNDKVDTVIGYDPATAGGWMVATRAAGGAWSGSLTTLKSGMGYWVHTTTFDPIKVDVPALEAGGAILPPAFTVRKGWNLVSVAVLNLSTTTVDPDNYFSSIKWARAYSYDTATAAYQGIIPADPLNPQLTVGKGYFVYATEAGTLVP